MDKAIYGTDITGLRHPDFNHDLDRISRGLISVEISEYPYKGIIALPGANTQFNMCIDTYREFEHKYNSVHMEHPYAAYVRGDVVTVSVKEPDRGSFECVFKELNKKMQHSKRNLNTVEEIEMK